MTIEEIHREFDILLDKVSSSAYPEIQDYQKDVFLNNAMDKFIKQRYGLNNIYRTGFEQTQKRTDDLKNLVITKYATVSELNDISFFNYLIYKVDIESLFNDNLLENSYDGDYMFYIKSMAYVQKGSCNKWSNVNLVYQNDLATLLNDPFNKPSPENPIIYFEDGNIFCVVGNGSVDKFQLTFIKRPDQMNLGTYGQVKVECELSDHTHREIISIAVTSALEDIESQRVQSNLVINENKIE